jgi:ATP-dependent DNA helicase RecQ
MVVDRHREHEFEMLERMLGYAQTLGCRRSYILEYFGENSVESCGSCDNCQNPAGSDASGLVGRIIQVRSEIAQQSRMDPVDVFEDRTARALADVRPRNETELLEVWGIGPVRARRWGKQLLDEVQKWEADNPDAAPRSVVTAARKTTVTQSRRPDHDDMPLFDVLREWRKTRAAEEGIPAFVVFSDRTLAALASARPTNMDELFTVFGVGAAKRDRFGRGVLEVIEEFESAGSGAD